MRTLLAVTAALELGAGLALVACPSAMAASLVGAPLETPAALTVARVGGAALLALAIACWTARDDGNSRAARGLVAAMLLYNAGTVASLAFAGLGWGMQGLALWPGVAVHTAMAAWCAAVLRQCLPAGQRSR